MLRCKLCFLTVHRLTRFTIHRVTRFLAIHRLTLSFFFIALLLAVGLSLFPSRASSNSSLVRLTNTAEQALNLNPSLSDNGRVVVFESSADFFAGGLNDAFHAMRGDVAGDPPVFVDVGRTRIVSPALSADGSIVAFASSEDLVGQNADRNSEIFLLTGSGLKQLTHSEVDNLWPSITSDGRLVVFTSGGNPYLYDVPTGTLTLLSEDVASIAKISGDGSKAYYQRGDDLVVLDVRSATKRIAAAGVPKLAIANGKAVSNDGTRIVYSAEVATNQTQVFLYDAREDTARQLTQLGSRSSDVPLNATISGDGKRVAFATRRRVTNTTDGSVELYLYDIPSGQIQQVTNAPSSATAEVVASLNFDGSKVVFSFPRVFSGDVADGFENNSEIYLAPTVPRLESGAATIFNAATQQPTRVAPGSIATIRGTALAFTSETWINTDLPSELSGTTVKVNGQTARMVYVSPEEVVFIVPEGLADGPAEFVVRNRDGFESNASATVSATVPGIFTVAGNGEGEAIALDSDTQVAGPFDPTNGNLRLSLFATGIAHARNVSVTINGQPLKLETITPSNLPGLDELHVLVPAELRGAGKTSVAVTADGLQANATTLTLSGSSVREVVINELLADPPDGLNGDANHDGVRDSSADEFVELVNATTNDIDLSGYQLQSRSLTATNDTLRHRFAPGTTLPADTAVVIFGGGSLKAQDPTFGGSQILKASSGGLSLVNGGGVVTLRKPNGDIVTSVAYGSSVGIRGDQNQSITRSPDVTGSFALHSTVSDRLFSPGTKLDDSAFSSNSATASIASPANIGHALSLRSDHFAARALRFRQLPRRPT
jgi:uncharacterized protein (TIGR03437 family)